MNMDRISITTSVYGGGDYDESFDPAVSSPPPPSAGEEESSSARRRDPASRGGSFNPSNPASSSTPNGSFNSNDARGGDDEGGDGGAAGIDANDSNNNRGANRPRPPLGARATSTTSRDGGGDANGARDPRTSPTSNDPPSSRNRPSPWPSDEVTVNRLISELRDSRHDSQRISELRDSHHDSQRISELRDILCIPGMSDEEISEMIVENDRAMSETSRLTQLSAGPSVAEASSDSTSGLPSRSSASGGGAGRNNNNNSNSNNNNGGTRRRMWFPCQTPSTRPGAISVGGDIEGADRYDLGVLDPTDLDVKKIEAIHYVKDTLNRRLGYDLQNRQTAEDMEVRYREDELRLASPPAPTPRPAMMMWDAPPPSRRSQVVQEPVLPDLEGPLPLPPTRSGVSEFCTGRVVADVEAASPDRADDIMDERNVEDANDAAGRAWADGPVDRSPMGPYDRDVRCWHCRACLRVDIEVGLVACPRCRTISPAR